jgi:hypothetical protein
LLLLLRDLLLFIFLFPGSLYLELRDISDFFGIMKLRRSSTSLAELQAITEDSNMSTARLPVTNFLYIIAGLFNVARNLYVDRAHDVP